MSCDITIGILSYNQGKYIGEAIESALKQKSPSKEIVVVDDASTDGSQEIISKYPVRIISMKENKGIAGTLKTIFINSKGQFILFLCGDDYFTDENVAKDMVNAFRGMPKVGVMCRWYYQFLEGTDRRPVALVRGTNPVLLSCNPSGIALRKTAAAGEFSGKMFIEMPSMVNSILAKWGAAGLTYDAVAVRLHPGGNTATIPSYYINSPTETWNTIVPGFVFYEGFIQLKNRAPHVLMKDIKETILVKPLSLLIPKFWACAILALIVPRGMLIKMTDFYRRHISWRFCKIQERRPE